MDLETREKVETDLERLITRRDKERRVTEGERREHELWQENEDRYNEQRRLQNRYEWHAYHCGQAERHRRTLEELIARHEEQAAKLLDEGRPNEASEADTGAA
jgi:hypothetical protein